MIASLDATGALAYLAERSVAFGVVFLVAGLLWLLLRRWLSAHTGSVWFLLPLVVLVLPVERWSVGFRTLGPTQTPSRALLWPCYLLSWDALSWIPAPRVS